MKHGRIQAKDIPEAPILAWLAANTAEFRCATHWRDTSMRSVADVVPAEIPEKVLRAKLAALKRRGLVNGCDCGCRGDWYITDAGRVSQISPADPSCA